MFREAGENPRKGCARVPIKEGRTRKELCGVTEDSPRAGDRALSPAGSRLLVETPSQREPVAAYKERGVAIFAGYVPMELASNNLTFFLQLDEQTPAGAWRTNGAPWAFFLYIYPP